MLCKDGAARTRGLGVGLFTLLAASTAHAAPTNPGELMNPLADSSDCNYCHGFANQDNLSADPPYAPQTTWTPSLMAKSSVDPVFWAAIAVAEQDDEEDFTSDCIRCHSPNAFLNGRGSATAIEQLEVADGDLDGVTCELCHRMTEGSLIGNAQYEIDDVLQGNFVVRRGPWDYTDGVPQPEPSKEQHATTFDAFTGSSELCGTCHYVTTHRERVDADGTGFGYDFNEQRTYSEWLGSAYAQPGEDFRSCVDCHMPEIPDSAACGPYNNVHQHPFGNRRHDLLGANRFMLTLLSEDAQPGFEAVTYQLAIEQMDEFVKTSATMTVEPPDAVDVGVGIEGLTVTVTNETGHKLPSGYSEGRVMWIEVVGRYNDEVVLSSGLWNQKAGTIQDDPAVRRYEGIAQDLETGTRNHLLLNNTWVSDTRIPPRGLQPNSQTDPVGDRYAMVDGAWQHWDEVAYTIAGSPETVDATPDDAGDDELQLSVRLMYLINSPEYINQLADDNETTEVGTELAGRFDAMGGAVPVVLAEETVAIPISGFGGEAGSSTSTGMADSSTSEDPTSSPGEATTNETTTPTTAEGSSTDTESAGADGGSGGGGGGGCIVGGRGTPWALTGLLLLGFIRRRR